jgi:hypothetical protein
MARELFPDEVQLNTPLRPNPERPLSPEEMEEIEAAFVGLPVLNVYKAARESSIRGGFPGRRGDPPTLAPARGGEEVIRDDLR